MTKRNPKDTQVWGWDGWCSLEIPYDWHVDEGNGIITLSAAGGFGALQLSFAKRENHEPVSVEDAMLLARKFADSNGWIDVLLETEVIDSTPAARFEHREVDGGEVNYWCVWCIVDDRRAALITYVSTWKERLHEQVTRGEIVASFTWL